MADLEFCPDNDNGLIATLTRPNDSTAVEEPATGMTITATVRTGDTWEATIIGALTTTAVEIAPATGRYWARWNGDTIRAALFMGSPLAPLYATVYVHLRDPSGDIWVVLRAKVKTKRTVSLT